MACKVLRASSAPARSPFRRLRRRQRLADRRLADLHLLGPRFDKSKCCASRTRSALETIGRSGIRVCGQRELRNAKIRCGSRDFRLPFPLWPSARCGNKGNTSAAGHAAKPGFCRAGRADDTHGGSGSYRRGRPSITAGGNRLEACRCASRWRARFRGFDSCNPADRFGGRSVPVIIWIWATKEFALALPLTIYLLIVGFADNVLKPMLMGRGLNTPMLVIFIGVLGGMLAHGILGLFVGPIILAVTWELIMAWIREERAESASFEVEQAKGSQAKPGVQPQHSISGLPPPPRARSDS